MAFGKMDPSCTIGFYAAAGPDLDELCSDLTRVSPCCRGGAAAFGVHPPLFSNALSRPPPPLQVLTPPSAPERYPIFTVAEGQAQDHGLEPLSSCPPPATATPPCRQAPQKTRHRRVRLPLTPSYFPPPNPIHWIRCPGVVSPRFGGGAAGTIPPPQGFGSLLRRAGTGAQG